MSFKTFADLNEPQRSAVEPRDGILLVCAGAGSGKTRVITQRVIHLVAVHDVSPSSIVALTFTNKAAREMHERIVPQLQSFAERLPAVSTFHSYCLQQLRMHKHLFELGDATILDEDDREKLLTRLIGNGDVKRKCTPSSLAHAISMEKNQAISGAVNPLSIGHPLIRELFIAYEEEKTRSRCLDFDDLILEVIKLFRRNKEFKTGFQRRVRHVLVDEYQDTNKVQHALLQEMVCGEDGLFALDSLCVVGDEDQSIYSWRGATVSNIIDFEHDFAQTRRIALEQNYRSAQHILTVANSVIEHNRMRHPKNLWSEKPGTDRVRILSLPSDRQESDVIVRWIRAIRRVHSSARCAILYRSHYQSRLLEEAFIHQSIPYAIIGGVQFYERKEIKDLLAYLRLVVNPYDRVSFFRVLNIPPRGLGTKFEELFSAEWEQQPLLPFDGIVQLLIDRSLVAGTKRKALESFTRLIAGCRGRLLTGSLQYLLQETGYLSYLQEAHDEETAEEKIANVRELVNAVQAAHARGVESISQFLEEVALLQEHQAQSKDRPDAVFLMTLHAAKGLEFDYVALPGLEEGVFPSGRAAADSLLLEEERRLFYVGLTRARERVLVTNVQQRYLFGRVLEQIPARFLREIPAGMVRCDESFGWYSSQVDSYFARWQGGALHPGSIR